MGWQAKVYPLIIAHGDGTTSGPRAKANPWQLARIWRHGCGTPGIYFLDVVEQLDNALKPYDYDVLAYREGGTIVLETADGLWRFRLRTADDAPDAIPPGPDVPFSQLVFQQRNPGGGFRLLPNGPDGPQLSEQELRLLAELGGDEWLRLWAEPAAVAPCGHAT